MKKLFYIPLACASLMFISSCEQDLDPIVINDAMLNFVYYDYSNNKVTSENIEDYMLETTYSFSLRSATLGKELTSDTVWFEVSTMGRLSDQNRPVELEQIMTGENDAVEGVHYLAFNDPQLLTKSFIPANKNTAMIPIVVLRDASLEEHSVNLQFTFKDNGYFKPGYAAFSTQTLIISDPLSKPTNWDSYYCDYDFGAYTERKHELMIEWTGNNWDEDYLDELFASDTGYVDYLSQWFINKLEEENQKRLDAGLDIYREPTDSDGDGVNDPVSFEPVSWH